MLEALHDVKEDSAYQKTYLLKPAGRCATSTVSQHCLSWALFGSCLIRQSFALFGPDTQMKLSWRAIVPRWDPHDWLSVLCVTGLLDMPSCFQTSTWSRARFWLWTALLLPSLLQYVACVSAVTVTVAASQVPPALLSARCCRYTAYRERWGCCSCCQKPATYTLSKDCTYQDDMHLLDNW